MLAIIGTYRRQRYIGRLLDSLRTHAHGLDRFVFVDDSGSPENAELLRAHGDVVETGARGYGAAMTAVCELGAQEPYAAFLEEDFTLEADVDFDELGAILTARPHLAQIALLRGPWFPIEHEHGGLLEGLEARLPGTVLGDVDGVIEQTGTFTCNPAVWRREVFATGWPAGRWSEDRKRDQLLAAGYRFGFMPGVKVRHDGERTGKGY